MLILVKQINKCYKYDNESGYKELSHYILRYCNYHKTN